MTEEDDIRKVAKRRIKARRDYWANIAIFVAISIVLTGIWYFTGAGSYFWPVWPIFGMTIAAIFMGLNVYGVLRRDINEADIDAEIARMNRTTNTGTTPPTLP